MKKTKRGNRFFWCTTLVFAILSIIGEATHFFTNTDNRLLDVMISTLADRNTPDPDIVVIDINNDSIEQLKEYAGGWPWSRSIHADLINLLEQQKPKAIVFDMFFSEPDDNSDADQLFSTALTKTENVFLPIAELTGEQSAHGALIRELPATLNFVKGANADPNGRAQLLLPEAIPNNLWKVGSINFTVDSDGVGRHYDVYRDIAGWRLPSLATRLAGYLGITPPPTQSIIMDWQKSTEAAYPTLPYSQVLVNLKQNIKYPSENYFKNKIIIIGSTAVAVNDINITPISNNHPGLYILATAIDNIKNNKYFTLNGNAFSLTLLHLIALLSVCLIFIKTKQHTLRTCTLIILISILLLAVTYWMVAIKHLLPIAGTLLIMWAYFLTVTSWQYVQKCKTMRKANTLFGRSLNKKLIKQIARSDMSDVICQGQEHTITVLTTNIHSIAFSADDPTPQRIIELINEYFTEQAAIIYKHNGTLANIVDKCLVAFWNAPYAQPQHVSISINTAFAMIEHAERFKQTHQLAEFTVGIGIHTGTAIVGMLGAQQRQDYSATGDNVNLASYIAHTSRHIASILISEETKQACHNAFDFIDYDVHKLHGADVHLFEPKYKV